jgi:hypothetical protein
MKKTVLIFFGDDGFAAKQRAAEFRNGLTNAFVRHASAFVGEIEIADRVVLMPDVSPYDATRLIAAYGDKVEGQPPSAPGATEPECFTVGKGPRGKFYVKRGKEIITGPFETEAEANSAAEREKAIAA